MRRRLVSHLLTYTVGVFMVGGLALPYNRAITGDPFKSPLMDYYETYFGPNSNALGFGPESGLGWAFDAFPGHSPFEALLNAGLNLFSVNIELFGWATGSLILISILIFSGRMERKDFILLSVILAIILAYSLYWFHGGPDLGARYWYLMIIPLVALSVRGLEFLAQSLQESQIDAGHARVRVAVGLVALCAFSLVNYIPWRAVDKYHHYLGMRPDIRTLSSTKQFGRSLVLIRGNEHPDYQSAWAYNPLDLRSDATVFAWDRNDAVRSRLLAEYGDRPVWLVDGPSITHSGFLVRAGPMAAHDLIR